MDNINELMQQLGYAIIDSTQEPEELIQTITPFYLGLLASYGINSFDVTLGEARVAVDGACSAIVEAETKPYLELVH